MDAHQGDRDIFQALADPTRRKLLKLIVKQKEMSIVSTAEAFPTLSRTAITKHLFILYEAGFVGKEKMGREVHYTIQLLPLKELQDWLAFFSRYWNRRLVTLQLQLEVRRT